MIDYTEIILDHYRHPRNVGKLSESFTATATNSSCGDSITVCLRLKSGKVTDFKWQGTGCAISQASASILSEQIIGKKITHLKPITVIPARKICASLVINAIHNAI